MITIFFRFIFWFRYKIEVKGLENLDRERLKNPGGVLFLPNHPGVLVDPVLVSISAWKKVTLRPIIVEYMYNLPIVHTLMRYIDALPMPDFESSINSVKRKQGEKAINEIVHGLQRGESFLIYPAGRLKRSCKEEIGGASGTHQIIQGFPEANVILVRTKGLYGSIFSSAFCGRTPPLFPTIFQGIKILLKNLIFFAPRRRVIVEFHPAPSDFPRQTSRLELNKWLERWYNLPDGLTEQEGKYPGDSLILVSYAFWKTEIPELYRPKEIKAEIALTVGEVNEEVQTKVYAKLQEIADIDPQSIRPEMLLSSDLGLDSLDISEVAAFLHEQFNIASVPVTELTTVGRVLGIASKKIRVEKELKLELPDISKWKVAKEHKRAQIAEGKTIPEVFLNNCERLGESPACADFNSGILGYPRLKLAVIILAGKIQKYPGKYIGILLPASVGAYLAVLACQLAGKVPMMINWTIGPRHLKAVRELSKVEVVLTSWAFLEKLENADLTGIDDILITLESIKREFSLFDKLKGKFRSMRSTQAILRAFGQENVSKDDQAVLLFTSGTESLPKGVPLSHENILSNSRAAFSSIEIYEDDIMLGILPPFHAYGFTVSGLMGLLSGIRSAFYPNPTDGQGVAKAFEAWRATVMSGAPSFIKTMLKSATSMQMNTLRICVTGAEKAPAELSELMAHIGKEQTLIEGYGVTECSPVIAANRPGKPRKGVGMPLEGIEVCIVHPENFDPLPVGSQGLVLTRGPNVFKGYLNPSLESPFLTVNGKDWYNTGDIGVLDEEKRLTLHGRKKRFIKIGGEMISLLSIESALLQAAPLMGWPMKDEGITLAVVAKELVGEKPIILSVMTFDVSAEDVNTGLRAVGFSNLIKISKVVKLDEIPLMGTGKVNYRVLEEKYLQN